jgi:hypothetical protein
VWELIAEAGRDPVTGKRRQVSRVFRGNLRDATKTNFHSLGKFMETYGQDLGFSPVQVAMHAGHDPSVAAKHYTGALAATDRALVDAVSGLLAGARVDTAQLSTIDDSRSR